jgi:hypothetical protein
VTPVISALGEEDTGGAYALGRAAPVPS